MDDKLIDSFEVKCSWGASEVMVSEYKNGHRLEHRYYNVPKSVVMQLLDSSKQPSVSDFDSWVRDEAAKQKKKQESRGDVLASRSSWWNQR